MAWRGDQTDVSRYGNSIRAISAGIELASSIIVGGLVGFFLGRAIGEGPAIGGLIVGLMLGLVGGLYRLYRKYK